jgi:hypothetical protein
MFAANLRMSEQRRHAIKDTLQSLESAIQQISQKEASSYDRDAEAYDHYEQPQSLEIYFQMLHRCRKGRYGFWRDFVGAVEEGFKYIEDLMADSQDDWLLEAHNELRRWIAVNDKKLESLMARDEDHVYRVDNVSHMVCGVDNWRVALLLTVHSSTVSSNSETCGFSPASPEPHSTTVKT